MKKLSWPYIGDTESEMGSMSPKGDPDRDIAPLYNDGSRGKAYGTFNDSLHSGGEDTYDYGHEYSDGTFFPLHDLLSELEETEYGAELDDLNSFANSFVSSLRKKSTIISWGDQDDNLLKKIKNLNFNIIAVNKKSKDNININSFASADSNIMFYKPRVKCDGFFNSRLFESAEESKIAIKNIYSNLNYNSYGLFISKKGLDLEGPLKQAGFSIIRKNNGLTNKLLVKKNSLKNNALVRHFNSTSNCVSSFICDVAETSNQKVAGLQPYSSLSDNCGLLFKYNKPENLTFHMGSVKFPIDIIFIDNDDKVKKIYSNIQPGSLELFTCANSKNVLEVCGGISEALNINVGDKVFLDFDSKNILSNSILASDSGLSSCIIKESETLESNLQRFKRFSVLTKNSKDQKFKTNIIKNASISTEKNIAIFSLNDFIPNEQIPLYRKAGTAPGTAFGLSLFSESFLTSGDMIKVSFSKLYENNFYKNINKKYALNLSDLIYSTNKNCSKLLSKLTQCVKEDYKIAFVYNGNFDSTIIKEAIEVGLNSSYTNNHKAKLDISDAECIKIPVNYDAQNIIEAAQDRYETDNIEVVLSGLTKSAGVPVNNETKAIAKDCIKHLDRAIKFVEKIKANLNQNSSVYEKLVQKPNVIKNSAGEYSQSSKRNSKICKEALLNIKESISLLNSIKDISTTEEIIGSIADLSKIFSSSVLSIFDLINQLDSDDFVSSLTEETKKATGASDDLIITIERTKAYITKDILGIIILSE